MNQITVHDAATPEVIDALLQCVVPVGWESTPDTINLADATETQAEVIRRGIELVRSAARFGPVDKTVSPDAYLFSMEPKFELSRSLLDAGWRQWHAVIRLPQRDGFKAKATHYPVHVWLHPDGRTVLAKLKLEGKAPLE